jgi:hypothetical protein
MYPLRTKEMCTSLLITKVHIQWSSLIIIAGNVINLLLLSQSVVPKHSI